MNAPPGPGRPTIEKCDTQCAKGRVFAESAVNENGSGPVDHLGISPITVWDPDIPAYALRKSVQQTSTAMVYSAREPRSERASDPCKMVATIL